MTLHWGCWFVLAVVFGAAFLYVESNRLALFLLVLTASCLYSGFKGLNERGF